MHLYCQSCGAQIQAIDLNPTTLLAWCRLCQAVTNLAAPPRDRPPTILAALSNHIIEVPEAVPPAACRPRDRVPQPKNVRVRDCGNALEISSRWPWPWGLSTLALFCVIWDVFLVMWYLQEAPLSRKHLFCLPLVAVGVGFTYYVVACLLHRTVVRADSQWVQVWHGPIPWWGRCRLPRAKIQQLYCCWSPGLEVGFDVMALLQNRRRVPLLRSLCDRDHVLFLEQTLEEYLGIPDRLVPGEMPR